jgi:hypothetical protein
MAALAAVAAAVSVTGCGSTATSSAHGTHTSYVRLTSGTYHGVPWQLFAWEQKSQLCMELLPGGADPGHPQAGPSWPAAGGGGCAFDHRDPGSGYYASSTGPAGSGFSYGPLPARATQIRTATREILVTRPLPSGKGLPSGRYWIHLMPAGWPSEAEGNALDTPQPLDSRGQAVPFAAF